MYIIAFDCTENVNVVFYNKKHEQNKKRFLSDIYFALFREMLLSASAQNNIVLTDAQHGWTAAVVERADWQQN